MLSNIPFRLGFIGGGINSAVGNTHRIATQMDKKWMPQAGCFSTNKEINLQTAAEFGIDPSRTYDTWGDFLGKEQGKLDAVCILTPTTKHLDMVIAAIELGYAVICEKAMTTSLKNATRICEAVRKKQGFLAVTYNYTGYPMLRELRQMVIKGDLGTINQIQIEMPQEGFARLDPAGKRPTPQAWRLKDIEIPTISLDLGVHLHHMIYFLCGEKPIEVVADQSTFGFFQEIIDNVMCIARYTNGLKSQLWYSKTAIGHRNGLRVRIYGDRGGAEWFQMQPEDLLFNDIYGNRKIIDRASTVELSNKLRYNRFKSGHPAGFIEAFANHYYDIAECLAEFKQSGKLNSPFVFTADLAKEGLSMFEAVARSSENHCWQPVN